MSILTTQRRRASTGGFDALSISGCVCWLRPLVSTMLNDGGNPVGADGDLVGTWLDQSGEGNDATFELSTTRCPLYKIGIQNSLPMVKFDGSNDYLTANGLTTYFDGLDTPSTLAFVIKKVGNASTQCLFAVSQLAASTPRFQTHTTTTDYVVFKRDDGGVTKTPSSGTVNTDAHLWVVRLNGTTVDSWIDGTSIIAGSDMNVGTITLDRTTLGAFVTTTTGNYLNGYVGEGVVYSRALSDSEILSLRSGLLTRWAL